MQLFARDVADVATTKRNVPVQEEADTTQNMQARATKAKEEHLEIKERARETGAKAAKDIVNTSKARDQGCPRWINGTSGVRQIGTSGSQVLFFHRSRLGRMHRPHPSPG